MRRSENDYDWLGHGIYFWEHGRERAQEWAEEQARRNRLKEPAVIGALMYLGNCFDLLDTRYTQMLGEAYPDFEELLQILGVELPTNGPLSHDDRDALLRRKDCAVMNWALDRYEKSSSHEFHTVRGLFQEGEAAFPGSAIRKKSHIQIAVRHPSCVLGYFLPA